MKRILFITAAVLLICTSAAAASPKTKTQKLVNSIAVNEPFRGGVWGVLAVNGRGDTLANYNRNVRMLPASNTKLLTTGAALKALGAEFRFETKIGYSGEIVDGTLYGDVYIIGGGDPTLGADYDNVPDYGTVFHMWKDFLDNAGIKSIQGRVLGDPRFFDGDLAYPGWSLDDMCSDYGAGSAGLNFAQNVQSVLVSPGEKEGDPFTVGTVFPMAPWMVYNVSGKTGARGSGSSLEVINTEFGPYAWVRGYIAQDRKARKLYSSNRYPAFTCAYYFHNYLLKNGLAVTAGYGDITPEGYIRTNLVFVDERMRAAENVQTLGSTFSPTLKEIAFDTNHISDNFFAETMLHMIGKVRKGSSTYYSSLSAEREIFAEMGVDFGNCRQSDGSGLSRTNYITPDLFVSFLKAMKRQEVFEDYLASLPQPGGWGTLDDRFKDSPQSLKDRIHMKSGTLGGVRCFSGYLMSPDGNADKDIEFSILTNNMVAGSSAVTKVIESIIISLASEK